MRLVDIISSVPPTFKSPLVYTLPSVVSNIQPVHSTFCVIVLLSYHLQVPRLICHMLLYPEFRIVTIHFV